MKGELSFFFFLQVEVGERRDVRSVLEFFSPSSLSSMEGESEIPPSLSKLSLVIIARSSYLSLEATCECLSPSPVLGEERG